MAVFARCTRVLMLALGLFAFVWGAKLVVIDRFGSDVPVWDQWHVEGATVILPWMQERFDASVLVQPHNEHRVACTRLLALGLFVANGQWDARLECVANAALHAALAVAVFLWGCRLIDARWRVVWLLANAALFAAPVAWSNVVSGFHSQQYFLLWFSLGAIALLPTAAAGTVRWWIGVACGVLAIFSMASGLLAALVAALVCLLDGGPRTAWRRHRATLLVCAGILVFGALLHVTEPAHAALKARSPGEYLRAFRCYLEWPYERLIGWRSWRMAVLPWLQWLPWIWLGARLWRTRSASDPRERVLFAIGVWTLLQFAASAYARGAHAPWPPSRYVDTLVAGLLVNALALLVLLSRPPQPAIARRALIVSGTAAMIFATAGIAGHVVYNVVSELPIDRDQQVRRVDNLRAYLATNDPDHLDGPDIPFPDRDLLITWLNDADLRSILPAHVQSPPAAMAWLSRTAQVAAHGGAWILVCGAVLAGIGLACGRQSDWPTEQ